VQHTPVTRRTHRSQLLSGVRSDINPSQSAPSSLALRSEANSRRGLGTRVLFCKFGQRWTSSRQDVGMAIARHRKG